MIFVDELKAYPPAAYADGRARAVGARNGHRWCHLVADGGRAELLRFALGIGMREAWLQGDEQHGYHFDLTPDHRAVAVRAGAREVTSRELVKALMRSRRTT